MTKSTNGNNKITKYKDLEYTTDNCLLMLENGARLFDIAASFRLTTEEIRDKLWCKIAEKILSLEMTPKEYEAFYNKLNLQDFKWPNE